MAELIPVIRPWLSKQEEDAVMSVLRSGWIMAGPKVSAFEAAFAETVSAQFASAVTSCTAGLTLSLRAVGVKSGDVITKFDGQEINDFPTLARLVRGKKPDQKVKIEVMRDDMTIRLQLIIGRRGE